MTGNWNCHAGHENHGTSNEDACPDDVCPRDVNDLIYAICGYIFFTGEVNGAGMALWSDHDADGLDEPYIWELCMDCHHELLLLSIEGTL